MSRNSRYLYRLPNLGRGCAVAVLALLWAAACSDGHSEALVSGNGSGAASGSGTGASGNGGGLDGIGSGGTNGSNGSGGSAAACETSETGAVLRPIKLAFAFDVSGSMGHLDIPHWYHDPVKKWQPVVAATKAFFEDSSTVNISASMVLFPSLGDAAKCNSATYETPDVPMTDLPSAAFGTVLDAYTAEVAGGNWRGGTPTLAVVQGALAYLQPQVTENPEIKHALVLVTDGYPQGCGGGNSVTAVANELAAAAGIPTYVIGVENPTEPPATYPAHWPNWGYSLNGSTPEGVPNEPPATLAGLNQLAVAGGTEQAFIIATDNPVQTQAEFRAVIDRIRAEAISCELERPPPPQGEKFDPNKVNVRYDSGTKQNPLGYDAECEGDDAWRYKEGGTDIIELCPSTCQVVQADPYAALQVEFGCVRRNVIR